MQVEHLALNVPDPVAMARWYVDHLGMRIVVQSDSGSLGRFLADGTGRVLLEIYHNPSAAVPDYAAMDPAVLHLAFTAADMAAERARLIRAGARPQGEVATTDSGDLVAMLRDPWGLPLQLVRRARPMG